MERTGVNASHSILYSVMIGALNVAATIVSFRLVDRAGRRLLLLVSTSGTLVSLVLLGLTFQLSLAPVLSLVAMLGYIAFFAIGLGPIFWLLTAEIFPSAARATGASVSTATNWLANFAVGLAFLPLVAAIGQGPTFWVFAGVCVVALGFVARYVPETKGRSFGEIEAELHERWRRGTRVSLRGVRLPRA
jgi:MFS family permease